MSFYYNSNYEFNKNLQNYQSCYYLNLNGYTNSKFGQVRFDPPLSDAIVYRDVYYSPPDYNTLQHNKSKKPITDNLSYNYASINNGYAPCNECVYSIDKKCANYSNTCMNGLR